MILKHIFAIAVVVMKKAFPPKRASCLSILNEMKMILITDVAYKRELARKG